MLTSKQRACLRGQANSFEPIVHVGKGGVIDTIVKQTDDALTARELIKGKTLENAPCTSREAAEQLAEATRADVVQVIGRVFILYRQNPEIPKEKRIDPNHKK